MTEKRNSILCPNCRKLISMDETACPYCGLVRPGLHQTAGKLQNILFAFGPIKTIIYVNVFFFALSLLLFPGGIHPGGSPFSFLSPSDQSLLLLGATGTIPVIEYHRLWSLLSAAFLLARLAMAYRERASAGPLVSWLEGAGKDPTDRSLAVRWFAGGGGRSPEGRRG